MTLVLALKAEDGVVLVSDGQGTDSGGNIALSTKTEVKKLHLLNENIAWGASGSVALIQLLAENIGKSGQKWTLDSGDQKSVVRNKLHELVNAIQKQGRQQWVGLPNTNPPILECIFCGRSDGEFWILEMFGEGTCEFHENGYAIGSGKYFAQYAVVSTQHYGLKNKPISVARLVGYRAVQDAIKTAAFGLGDPIQMIAITDKGASDVDDDKLTSLRVSADIWREMENESLGKHLRLDIEEPNKEDEGLDVKLGH